MLVLALGVTDTAVIITLSQCCVGAGMEIAARKGSLKRKCQELAQYAQAQQLPYNGVLSWFDRNRKKLMATQGAPMRGIGPGAAMQTVTERNQHGQMVLSTIPGLPNPSGDASMHVAGIATVQPLIAGTLTDPEAIATVLQNEFARQAYEQQQQQQQQARARETEAAMAAGNTRGDPMAHVAAAMVGADRDRAWGRNDVGHGGPTEQQRVAAAHSAMSIREITHPNHASPTSQAAMIQHLTELTGLSQSQGAVRTAMHAMAAQVTAQQVHAQAEIVEAELRARMLASQQHQHQQMQQANGDAVDMRQALAASRGGNRPAPVQPVPGKAGQEQQENVAAQQDVAQMRAAEAMATQLATGVRTESSLPAAPQEEVPITVSEAVV